MRLIAAILLALSSITMVGLTAAPANAEKVCHTETEVIQIPGGGIQTIVKEVCVEKGNPGSPGSGTSSCSWEGAEIPCTKLGFTWFSSHFCYAMNVTDTYSPPADFASVWQGNTEGSIWQCQGAGPDMTDIGSPDVFWIGGAPPVDGAAVAQKVVEKMPLAKPNISLAPQPPLLSYVGLETWLWMPDSQWATLTDSASVSSATVTVTATPVQAAWSTGDSKTEYCSSAGKAWLSTMTEAATTSCSHTYQKTSRNEPDDKFPVSATLTYEVTWACSGNCISASGELDDVNGPTSDVAGVRVSERQSVIVSGGHG